MLLNNICVFIHHFLNEKYSDKDTCKNLDYKISLLRLKAFFLLLTLIWGHAGCHLNALMAFLEEHIFLNIILGNVKVRGELDEKKRQAISRRLPSKKTNTFKINTLPAFESCRSAVQKYLHETVVPNFATLLRDSLIVLKKSIQIHRIRVYFLNCSYTCHCVLRQNRCINFSF